MITAWISGHAGRAIIHTGDRFVRLDVASPEALPADATHARALLSWGFEVAEVTGQALTESEVRTRLHTLWRRDRTIVMLLGAIDRAMPANLRERAVVLASKHLVDPEIREMVRRRLFAATVPEQMAGVPLDSPVGQLVLDWAASREAIATAIEAWEEVQRELLEDVEFVHDLRLACVDGGGFVAAVEAFTERNHRVLRRWLSVDSRSDSRLARPEGLLFLEEWTALFESKVPSPKHVIILEQPRKNTVGGLFNRLKGHFPRPGKLGGDKVPANRQLYAIVKSFDDEDRSGIIRYPSGKEERFDKSAVRRNIDLYAGQKVRVSIVRGKLRKPKKLIVPVLQTKSAFLT